MIGMFKQATNKRVAVFFASGLEECEALILVDLIYRAGIPCDKVSITGEREVTGSHEITITCDCTIDDAGFDFEAYDMLVLPGGLPGTPNLAACEPLTRALKTFAAAGKEIAAICAAPSVFAELGLLEDRYATSNPGFQEVLAKYGAHVLQDSVVVDGNITTSQGLGTAIDLGLALVGKILGPEDVEDLKGKIVYQGA